MLILIAAVAKNNIIGKNGAIPWDIPEERNLFKRLTMGNPIIMGRKTFESIGHSLPGRKNIILSRSGIYQTIESALLAAEGKPCFVIGGGQVYDQMMPIADEMRISHLNQAFSGDTLFPPIDPAIWKEAEKIKYPEFTHIRYIRI